MRSLNYERYDNELPWIRFRLDEAAIGVSILFVVMYVGLSVVIG